MTDSKLIRLLKQLLRENPTLEEIMAAVIRGLDRNFGTALYNIRELFRDEQRRELLQDPAGEVELGDEELEAVAGGVDSTECVSTWGCCGGLTNPSSCVETCGCSGTGQQ